MAFPVYSTRFLLHAPAGWTGVSVPAGYRAVVTNITAGKPGDAAVLCLVALAGFVSWRHAFQAAPDSVSFDTRLVLYAGETIEAYTDSPNAVIFVCGYLFTEAATAAGEWEEVVRNDPMDPTSPPPEGYLRGGP